MVFSAVFVITDGIFVGQGIGSDALAAVNITAPLFLISTGIGLMFGVGASVVASIHLSQGKLKAARINVTQAVVVSSLFLAVLSILKRKCGLICRFRCCNSDCRVLASNSPMRRVWFIQWRNNNKADVPASIRPIDKVDEAKFNRIREVSLSSLIPLKR